MPEILQFLNTTPEGAPWFIKNPPRPRIRSALAGFSVNVRSRPTADANKCKMMYNLLMRLPAILLLFGLFHGSASGQDIPNPAEIKQLLPPDATIAKAEPPAQAEAKKSLRSWYTLPARKEQDCIALEDVDGDGKKELIVVYLIPVKGDSPESELSIYKWVKGKWVSQFRQNGSSVVVSFGVVRLLGNKAKQIFFNSGMGASVGYSLSLIQYNGERYKSIITDGVNWGATFYDINKDKKQELVFHYRYSPLPVVFSWDSETQQYTKSTDGKLLEAYYRLVINVIKSPLDNEGNFDDGYAWALFESYDKLGDSANAIKIGRQLIDAKDLGAGYGWYNIVKDRLAQLEKPSSSDNSTVKP